MGLGWNQHKVERAKGVDTARGGRKGVEGRLPFSTSQAFLSRLSLVVVPIVPGLYRLCLPLLSYPRPSLGVSFLNTQMLHEVT